MRFKENCRWWILPFSVWIVITCIAIAVLGIISNNLSVEQRRLTEDIFVSFACGIFLIAYKIAIKRYENTKNMLAGDLVHSNWRFFFASWVLGVLLFIGDVLASALPSLK